MTKKRLSKQEKNQKVVEELINKMFYIAGHNISYEDIKDRKDSWYQEWEMTKAQNDAFTRVYFFRSQVNQGHATGERQEGSSSSRAHHPE